MKVLLIDDEDLIRRSLRRVFESKSHEVHEASDGETGLILWRQLQPDLVVLDVLMPGLTGPQVLAEIGRKHRSKVVLVSAYTGDYDPQKAKELGADLFLPKPFQNIFDVVARAEELIKR